MKTSIPRVRGTVVTGLALAALFSAPIPNHSLLANPFNFISQANAAGEDGGKGKMGSSSKGSVSSHGSDSSHASGSSHGKKDIILKGNFPEKVSGGSDSGTASSKKGIKGLGGGGQPTTSGSKKGDLYGDLYVLIRDTTTGVAGTEVINGVTYPLVQAFSSAVGGVALVDAAGNPVAISRDPATGDLLKTAVVDGVTVAAYPASVEFSRLSVARAPSKVLDHALSEAITKLDLAAKNPLATITLDAAGRLVVTVYTDSSKTVVATTSTIDSPLENLALYQAVMALPAGASSLTVVPPSKMVDGVMTSQDPITVTLTSSIVSTLKASLLAAAADKTKIVTLDTVMYLLPVLKVNTTSLSSYTYDRTAAYSTPDVLDADHDGNTTELIPTTVPVLKLNTSTGAYEVVTVSILDAVPWTTSTTESVGATAYTQAVDDALQVIEFVHDNQVR